MSGSRRPHSTALLLLVGFLVYSPCVLDAASRRRPNILFIMTDQHRFDCLGANGNTLIRTPNLDRLAARSANLQNAFVQAPVCVPSRVTWFTGRYPHSHRNRVNYTPLTKAEVLMQKRLQQAGYATAAVGKLHLYPADQQEAKHSGFDRVALHDGAGITDPFSDYVRWRRANDPRRDTPYRAYAEDIGSGENPFRSAIADEFTDTTWTGMKAREFLQDLASGKKPFFLFVSFWKPHSPYEVPVPFASLYDDVEIPMPEVMSRDEIGRLPLPVQKMILRSEVYDMDRERLQWMYRSYYGSITHVDREVGSILDVLEKSGRSKDTIIIFSSDHGDQLLDHGMVGKNVFFETSIRVPFLFSFPGRVCPGDYHQLIETTDLLPTLFELAEVAVAPHTQGRSFARLIADAGSPYQERQYVFSENIMPEVITGGRFDYHFEKGKGVGGVRHPDAKMVRSQRWKLNYYPGNGGELYDLQNDPGEQRNLYRDEAHQPLVQQLKEKILDWMITSDETEQIAERWRLRR